jgi:hypothetical protein
MDIVPASGVAPEPLIHLLKRPWIINPGDRASAAIANKICRAFHPIRLSSPTTGVKGIPSFAKSNEVCRALLPVPGVGVIVATALFSAIANISDFKTGRDLAAFLGLVPRQRSTGGKTVLLGISKRGNTYVRTLLIHGMRSAFYHRQKRDDRMAAFMERLSARGMHTNKIVVASANKAARIIWAILSKNTYYQSQPV